MRKSFLILACLALITVGCSDDDGNNSGIKYDGGGGGSDSGGDTGGTTADSGGSGGCTGTATETTICKIKSGTVAKGTCVVIKDAVVSAVDTNGSFTKDVYIQAKDGAKTCGIKLYQSKRKDGKLVTDLKPGTKVKVQGTLKFWHPKSGEFSDKTYTTKKHIKELEKPEITVLASGAAPTPLDVTIDQLTGKTTANTYEDVYVKVKGVAVAKISAPDPKYKNIDATIVDTKGNTMYVRDDLYPLTSLTELGCNDVAGVLNYFYAYRIQPTAKADLTTAATCPKPADIKISDIQDTTSTKHPKEDAWVKVSGVITAVDANPSKDTSSGVSKYTGFFMQDDTGKGTYDGIYVYYIWASNSQAKKPTAGKKITLTGIYDEYYDLSELKDVRWKENGTGTITAAEIDASKFTSDKTFGPKYEGMLVKVKDVEVGELAKTTKGSVIGIKDKTSKVAFEIQLYNFMKPASPAVAPKVGDKFKSITGVVTYSYKNWVIYPRSAADLVK